ncbi:LuxR family transcriptional regulator [Variovorax terrae]|uniref:LuxR family transcriptional regulator n=1 Tax=Variovorax terrae TaxID=2923278 RepID=A0A9X2APV2_9BURK|nr:LuxR family transcriptional regulator [Variovorax terrae]MCJ0765290.1 LuxR family transcriptional regulator [Variovorax terrae]
MTIESPLTLISSVLEASTEAEVLDRVQRAATALGFERVMLGIEVKRPLVAPVQNVTSGYPLAWQRVYVENQYVAIDPTVAHCQEHTKPLIWSEGLYTKDSIRLWEEARAYGIGHGISVPIHERFFGVKSMVSLARDKPLDHSPAALQEMMAAATQLTTSAHYAAANVILPSLFAARDPKLSPRERECLKWAAEGKSSWETAGILNISDGTARLHMNNAMRKLKVHTRTQAVALAVALGVVK